MSQLTPIVVHVLKFFLLEYNSVVAGGKLSGHQ